MNGKKEVKEMTMFEEICNAVGAGKGSEAEEILCGFVNELIFDEEKEYDDESIKEIVINKFESMYA